MNTQTTLRASVCLVLAITSASAMADDPFVAPLDRLRWSLGPSTTIGAGVRVQGDSTFFDPQVLSDSPPSEATDRSLVDDTDLRRARVSMRIDHKDWRLGLDYDVGISEGWKNVQLEYRGLRRQRLVVGNQIVPFSLEDITSSSNLPFAERSAAATLAPGTQMGLSYRRWWDRASMHVGAFGDEMTGADRRRLPGHSAAGRVTWSPLERNGAVIHLWRCLRVARRGCGRTSPTARTTCLATGKHSTGRYPQYCRRVVVLGDACGGGLRLARAAPAVRSHPPEPGHIVRVAYLQRSLCHGQRCTGRARLSLSRIAWPLRRPAPDPSAGRA